MPSADPGTAQYLAGLVTAEIGASASSSPSEPGPDDPGLRYLYQLTDIDDLGLNASAACSLLAAARQMQLRPPSVTGTTKWTVAEHLRDPAPQSAELREANALVLAKGALIRCGAGSSGLRTAFGRGFSDVAAGHVVVLGAGEACAAVGRAALELGAGRLTVADTADDAEEALAHADGLIRARAVGTDPCETPPSGRVLRPGMWVADVIYRPLEPQLPGHTASSALGAFRLLTGTGRPDHGRMLRYLATLTGTSAGNARSLAHVRPG